MVDVELQDVDNTKTQTSHTTLPADASASTAFARDGALDRLLLLWCFPLAAAGFKRPLTEENMPLPPAILQAHPLHTNAERLWQREVESAPRNKASLLSGVFRPLVWTTVSKGAALMLLSGVFGSVVRPLLLMYTIRALAPGVDGGQSWGLGIALGCTIWIESWCKSHGLHYMGDLAILRALSAAITLVSSKGARMRAGVAAEGAEQTLIGKDMIGAAEFARFLPFSFLGISSLVGGIVLLFVTAGGAAAGVGLGVMFSSLAVSGPIGQFAKKFQTRVSTSSERTAAATREAIDGVKVVKMMGWEEAYLDSLAKRRAEELSHLRRYRLCIAVVIQLGRSAPVIATMAACLVLSTGGPQRLSADVVLPLLSLFSSLRVPFVMLPMFFQILVLVRVASTRVERYLQLPDHPPLRTPPVADEAGANLVELDHAKVCWPVHRPVGAAAAKAVDASKGPAVVAEGDGVTSSTSRTEEATANATGGPAAGTAAVEAAAEAPDGNLVEVLDDVTLQVAPGSLVGLTGPVASGKTSLLAAVWGEAAVPSGEVRTSASLAIVPQRPFTIAGTLQDNILLGRPFDEDRFRRTLADCALGPDLDQLPGRECTQIGERGVTLSGGQQQRLGLARAMYGAPDLLLLDDPLSAVDAATCAKLLATLRRFASETNAIGGRRAALIACSQESLARSFDRVVSLRDGQLEVSAGARRSNALAFGWGGAKEDVASAAELPMLWEEASKGASKDGTAAVQNLTEREKKRDGAYTGRMYKQYAAALGALPICIYLLMCSITFGSYLFADIWLVRWIGDAEAELRGETPLLPYRTNAIVYSCGCALHVVMILCTAAFWIFTAVRASRALHAMTMRKVLYAPVSWFEATPSGRILSRFTSDLATVDNKLSLDIDNFCNMLGMLFVLLGYIAAALPVLAGVIVVVLLLFGALVYVADVSIREVRRMANNAVSPILSTIVEIKSGAPLVRAMGVASFFWERQSAHIAQWARFNYVARALQTWSGHVGGALAFALGMTTILYVISQRSTLEERAGALALTYAVITPYFVSFLSELFVQMKTGFAALERLLEYYDLPQEKPHELPSDPPVGAWPTAGRIEFRSLCLRYRPDLPLALDGLTATIEPGEKVGVVGRTGAGKSTLILALLRMVEPDSGAVHIDGLDTRTVGLRRLRSAVSIVPQDPVLHEGSVAHNIDPFGTVPEAELRTALRRARLDPNILSEPVARGGSNFSAGERQLLCIARALVSHTNILLMDEATSNLDEVSDQTVQELIRNEFASHTVLTIAHRLSTVAEFDRIFVLGGGRLVEEGRPDHLLGDSSSELSRMAAALGPSARSELRTRAQR